jgi:hypothetical protein
VVGSGYTGARSYFLIYRDKNMYIRSMDASLYYRFFPAPRMEELRFLITTASAFLQFTISRNVRQSRSDNDNAPEEVVGLSCALHKNCVDGRWKNVCARRLARAEWMNRNKFRLPTPSYARTTMYERLEIEVVDGCQPCLLPAPASLE